MTTITGQVMTPGAGWQVRQTTSRHGLFDAVLEDTISRYLADGANMIMNSHDGVL